MDASVFFNGLPSAILAGVLSLIISKPVGLALQEKFTTEGDLGDLKIKRVHKTNPSLVTRFFQLLLAPGKELKVNSYKIETVG